MMGLAQSGWGWATQTVEVGQFPMWRQAWCRRGGVGLHSLPATDFNYKTWAGGTGNYGKTEKFSKRI